jgi:hypothetical protein
MSTRASSENYYCGCNIYDVEKLILSGCPVNIIKSLVVLLVEDSADVEDRISDCRKNT